MRTYLITALLVSIAATVFAGPLDVLYYGVRGNPDRYVSVELLGTYGHDDGINSVPIIPGLSDTQSFSDNNRGMRGELRIPLDMNSTFVFGGGMSTGDFVYSPTTFLSGENGNIRSYNIEAGFKFYIHE